MKSTSGWTLALDTGPLGADGRGVKVLVCVALLLAGATRSCLDPTTAPPPPPDSPVPAFQHQTLAVSSADVAASWRPGCPVGPSSLRRLSMSHWGFDGRRHLGELVVHRDAVSAMLLVFRRLYDARYPVHRMHRVDYYDGSDDRSMAADNTSGFNCRRVTGSTTVWSAHSYGRAVDINPVENPYVKGTTVLPPNGRPYTDRRLTVPGVLHAGDAVVGAFAAVGWPWGGAWTSLKDYQHFSASGR